MSRNVDIHYKDATGKEVDIEIPAPYFLLGTQRPSMAFWSISRLREVGIERLAFLGEGDPVYFHGWEEMDLLGRELELLAKHLESVEFWPTLKAEWLSHLTYCYHLLLASTPRDCTPILGIG